MAKNAYCKNCFNQFTRKASTEKYCCKRCENEYLNSRIINNLRQEKKNKAAHIKLAKTLNARKLTCRYCRKVLKQNMVSKLYCSTECQSNYTSNMSVGESNIRYCRYCNKQFVPKKDEITKFCSVDCRKAKQKKVSGNNIG
ncbi:MAG: hypothetical protein WCL06_11890 [Bacteroidota bacterium]